MNKYTLLLISFVFTACRNTTVNYINYNDSELIVYDYSKTKKGNINLSQIVDDFQIVQFENSDTALFKASWMYFSENYICIKQRNNVCKLFDKKGKFISDIGGIGQGPGEYQNVYDLKIDENSHCIYLSQLTRKSILKYELNGNFIEEIKLESNLNKPRLFLCSDSILSLVHLCFKERSDLFNIANIKTDNIEYIYNPNIAVNLKDKEGNIAGFNNEIFAYRNTNDISFMISSYDTLYNYNPRDSVINARFTFTKRPTKNDEGFFIINELPQYFMILMIDNGMKRLFVNKNTGEGYEGNIINDYMGNMNFSPNFQDGYCYASYEPLVLKEQIENHIKSMECPPDKIKHLQEFAVKLNENDNNILLIGKLKN